MATTVSVEPGQIFCDNEYYFQNGNPRRKYFLILAKASEEDIVFGLLTSRQNGRYKDPPCYHGAPYPGFYLGRLDNRLTGESWLDLRELKDLDWLEFQSKLQSKVVSLIHNTEQSLLCDALDCAARAEDTTRYQTDLIYNQRARLGCT